MTAPTAPPMRRPTAGSPPPIGIRWPRAPPTSRVTPSCAACSSPDFSPMRSSPPTATSGAEQAIVLSASSKTAIGYAASAKLAGPVRLVGVTSAGNADFVRGVGYYDDVLTYDQLADIARRTECGDRHGRARLRGRRGARPSGRRRAVLDGGRQEPPRCSARHGGARADTGDVLRSRRRCRSPRRVGCGGVPAASARLAGDVHRRQLRLAHRSTSAGARPLLRPRGPNCTTALSPPRPVSSPPSTPDPAEPPPHRKSRDPVARRPDSAKFRVGGMSSC